MVHGLVKLHPFPEAYFGLKKYTMGDFLGFDSRKAVLKHLYGNEFVIVHIFEKNRFFKRNGDLDQIRERLKMSTVISIRILYG